MSRSRRKPCADHWNRALTHKKPARKAVRHFLGVIQNGGAYKRIYDLWGYDRKYLVTDKEGCDYMDVEKLKRK